jgi:hypothetical protein
MAAIGSKLSIKTNYSEEISSNGPDIAFRLLQVYNDYATLMESRWTGLSSTMRVSDFTKYINAFTNGLSTISHVFRYILYYTKSPDIATVHARSASVFFVEFIEQMNDENVTFLGLRPHGS